MDMDCYGHYRPRQDRCVRCRIWRYCRDAADPAPQATGGGAYDTTLAMTPAPEDADPDARDRDGAASEVAYRMREALTALLAATRSDAELAIAIARHAGQSYAAIAAQRNVTKQAIEKTLSRIAERNPDLVLHLRRRHAQVQAFSRIADDVERFQESVAKTLKEGTSWMHRPNSVWSAKSLNLKPRPKNSGSPGKPSTSNTSRPSTQSRSDAPTC